jgi:zinc/manganese transport system substrate-binding protein
VNAPDAGAAVVAGTARARRAPHARLCACLAAGLLLPLGGLVSACGTEQTSAGPLRVVASVGFLADIAQHVAGRWFRVTALIPPGVEVHAFEPGPADLRAVARCDLLLLNGAGLEGPLEKTLRDVGGGYRVVVASAGLRSRAVKPNERRLVNAGEVDPHFWLDPMLALTYVQNICEAFVRADPAHAAAYRAAAAAYEDQVRALDVWIRRRVALIPPGARKLVTDHASYGYFADAFGFQIVGAVNPSVSPEAMPSARHVAALVAAIRQGGVRALFVDAGENPSLAEQVAREAGATVVLGMRDHSLTPPGGPASTYVAMMEYDTGLIVAALR